MYCPALTPPPKKDVTGSARQEGVLAEEADVAVRTSLQVVQTACAVVVVDEQSDQVLHALVCLFAHTHQNSPQRVADIQCNLFPTVCRNGVALHEFQSFTSLTLFERVLCGRSPIGEGGGEGGGEGERERERDAPSSSSP